MYNKGRLNTPSLMFISTCSHIFMKQTRLIPLACFCLKCYNRYMRTITSEECKNETTITDSCNRK